MANMSKLRWHRKESKNLRFSNTTDCLNNSCLIKLSKRRNVSRRTSSSIKNSTSSGMRIFSRPKRKMLKPSESLKIDTLRKLRKTDKSSKKDSHWLSSIAPSFWTNRRYKLTSPNRRIIKMRIRPKLNARTWKAKRGKSTCKKDIKRSSLQRPNSSRSSKMRWTRSKRSLRATSMKDWSSEKPSTTSFCRDTKTSKKRSKTSKKSRESSSKRLIKRSSQLWRAKWDQVLPIKEALWRPEWEHQECSNLLPKCNTEWAKTK